MYNMEKRAENHLILGDEVYRWVGTLNGFQKPFNLEKFFNADDAMLRLIIGGPDLTWPVSPLTEFVVQAGIRTRIWPELPSYNSTRDLITLPPFMTFDNEESALHILGHELIHWTGHPRRLNRLPLFDDFNYDIKQRTVEEVTAELGSFLLCQELGFCKTEHIKLTAGYVSDWLKKTFYNDYEGAFRLGLRQASQAVRFLIP